MQRLRITWILISVLFMALLLLSERALAAGNSLYVNPSRSVAGCPAPARKTYDTIQAAVNIAGDSDTIYICPGTYTGGVMVIGKANLTIRNYVIANQPTPLIDASFLGSGFTIQQSSAVTIRGLRIANAGTVGIRIENAPKTVVYNNTVGGYAYGILIRGMSGESKIENNQISSQHAGIDNGADENGFGYQPTPNVEMTSNLIRSEIGILLQGGVTSNKISSNTIIASNSGTAIRFESGSNNQIEQNLIAGGQYGVYLSNTTASTVNNNTIKVSYMAIRLNGTSGVTVNQNTTVLGNKHGLFIDGNSTANTISNNIVRGSLKGIVVYSAPNNTFTQNVIQWSGGVDVTDDTTNSWSGNMCDKSQPAGLCSVAATQ